MLLFDIDCPAIGFMNSFFKFEQVFRHLLFLKSDVHYLSPQLSIFVNIRILRVNRLNQLTDFLELSSNLVLGCLLILSFFELRHHFIDCCVNLWIV